MAENKYYDPSEHEPMPEGREAPPPLTHTMGIVRWMILIGLSLFALVMILSWIGFMPWQARGEDTVKQYHCPMHPTYISNQPGECPICGMSLVPVDGSSATAEKKPKPEQMSETKNESARYVCPMHPEVVSNEPGECPKCGMDLVAASETGGPSKENVADDKPASKEEAEAVQYACPMHPEVTSDKPGRCPKCGMSLEPITPMNDMAPSKEEYQARPDSEGHGAMEMQQPEHKEDMGLSPVPGLVPITIEAQRLQLIGVKTGFVERRNLGSTINIVGFVTPDETRMTNVHVRVSGWVVELAVDKTGQYVEAGQPLMTLYSQDLYQAEQDLIVARDAFRQVSSDSALTGMRTQLLEAARQRLHLLGLSDQDIAEIEVSDIPNPQLTIRSPFSGYVLEKSVLPGQYLSPDQNLFTIADLGTVWVLGDVYEKDIVSVHVGQRATMRLIAFPGEQFKGKIGYLYPSVSQQTRTMKVRIHFPNPDLKLRPGMYAEVSVERTGPKTLGVPVDAVLDGGETQYAFVVHDGTHFEPRLLKLGRAADDWVEVLSGLSEGEEVVTSANFLIDSESRLKAAVAGMGGMPGMPEEQPAAPPGHSH